MNFDLTQHARDAIAKRKIAINWVEHVLTNPARVDPDSHDPALEHRLAAIAEFGNRALRVVVNRTVSPVRVVTLYFDRRMKGKL
jgi:uncharacterized DUF497 family protein